MYTLVAVHTYMLARLVYGYIPTPASHISHSRAHTCLYIYSYSAPQREYNLDEVYQRETPITMAQREGFQAFPMGRGEALHGRRPVRAELRAADGIWCAPPAPFGLRPRAPELPACLLLDARVIPQCEHMAHSTHSCRS